MNKLLGYQMKEFGYDKSDTRKKLTGCYWLFFKYSLSLYHIYS